MSIRSALSACVIVLVAVLAIGCTGLTVPLPVQSPATTTQAVSTMPPTTSAVAAATRHQAETPGIEARSTAAVEPTSTPPPIATVAPQQPPTATPDLSVAVDLPLLIDSAHGRILAPASTRAGREKKTVVLSASDGSQMAVYNLAGSLALDGVQGWLYADQGIDGLAIADAATGAVLRSVKLPALPEDIAYLRIPSPQADPATGSVLAVRDNTIYVVNGSNGVIERSIPFDLPKQENDCRTPRPGGQPITDTWFDASRRILYVSYINFQCTPYIGYVILSYDLSAGKEIARSGSNQFTAVASGGYLYGASWYRMGVGYVFAWRDGKPWRQIADAIASSGTQVDEKRHRVYQIAGGDLRVFDTETLSLLMAVAQPLVGQLAGYDPVSDNLYFLADGRVSVYRAASMTPPLAHPPQSATPPAAPITALAVSHVSTGDTMIAGIWGDSSPPSACYIWGETGGQMLLSTNGGESWTRPQAGLPSGCNRATALAISPDYMNDRTIFAGMAGGGLFKTTDGGSLWKPASGGLPSMSIQAILVSPGFAKDRTVVVHAVDRGMAISSDGGESWSQIGTSVAQIALSPDYEQDKTLLKHLVWGDRVELMLSRDGGASWALLKNPPGWLRMISVAPLFSKWQVLFAQNDQGVVYRSTDGGKSWSEVLSVPGAAQMAYGVGETNRPVFLISSSSDQNAKPPKWSGALYRSLDGGMTWSELALPGDAIPTALAISPDFAHDRTVIIGSATGQVLMLDGLSLPTRVK